MAQISKISIGDTSYSLGAASIPFAKVDNTSTATVFTATVPEITELKDGVCVYLMNGVVTSTTNCTLNINGLGAKPIYQNLAAASRSTTIFNIGYTMLFIYNSQRVEGGCWDIFYGYNSNDNTIAYDIRDYQANKKAALAIYRYMYCFTKRDGTIFPSTSASNKTTTNKTLNTDIAFDPTLPIYYYGYTTTINAGSSPSASYLWTKNTACSLQYGFNVATDSLDLKEPVYLQCSPQSNGTLKLANNNCVTQTLPSTADGYVYLYLGQTYSGHQIEFAPMHPCFIYDSRIGDIVVWHGAEYARKSELANYAPLSSPAFTGTPTIEGYNVLTTQDLTKVMHFRGVSSTAITDGGTETATIGGNQLTAEEGDVVIYNNVEYIWNGSAWEQMGDEYKLPIVIDINENDSVTTVENVKGYANNSGYTCTFLAQAFNKVPIYINFINTQNEKQIIRLQKYIPNMALGTYTGDLYKGFYTELDYITSSSDYSFIKEFSFIILNDNSFLGTLISNNLAISAATYAGSASTASTANYADIAGSADSASSADITTTINAIAKYSDASGTFADSGVTIDSNNNITTAGNLIAAELKGYVTVGQNINHLNDLGTNATAEGYNVNASGDYSHAEGSSTAEGDYSHSEGKSLASANYSHSESQSIASGISSHAEGIFTFFSGFPISGAAGATTYERSDGKALNNSMVGRYITTSSNYANLSPTDPLVFKILSINSEATPNKTLTVDRTMGALDEVTVYVVQYPEAAGRGSHVEGAGTKANGSNSHAEGVGAIASGDNSHAEGNNTNASGFGSHAEGSNTNASGFGSHAEGSHTIAARRSQHTFGEYNIEDTQGSNESSKGQYIEIVGNGTTQSSRSNARTLDWNGNEELAGKLTVGAAPTNNMDVTTKQYVDNLIPTSASVSSGVISFANFTGTVLFTVPLPIYNGGVS